MGRDETVEKSLAAAAGLREETQHMFDGFLVKVTAFEDSVKALDPMVADSSRASLEAYAVMVQSLYTVGVAMQRGGKTLAAIMNRAIQERFLGAAPARKLDPRAN